MLSRINRFHGHGTVRRVYRLGRPVRMGVFSMHALQNKHIKTTKVAVVVSKKVHKSAVKRNRIRRRVYELFRRRLVDIKVPTEIVVTVFKPDLADMTSSDLQRVIDDALKRSRLV